MHECAESACIISMSRNEEYKVYVIRHIPNEPRGIFAVVGPV